MGGSMFLLQKMSPTPADPMQQKSDDVYAGYLYCILPVLPYDLVLTG